MPQHLLKYGLKKQKPYSRNRKRQESSSLHHTASGPNALCRKVAEAWRGPLAEEAQIAFLG